MCIKLLHNKAILEATWFPPPLFCSRRTHNITLKISGRPSNEHVFSPYALYWGHDIGNVHTWLSCLDRMQVIRGGRWWCFSRVLLTEVVRRLWDSLWKFTTYCQWEYFGVWQLQKLNCVRDSATFISKAVDTCVPLLRSKWWPCNCWKRKGKWIDKCVVKHYINVVRLVKLYYVRNSKLPIVKCLNVSIGSTNHIFNT
jgi:hypothetical protein